MVKMNKETEYEKELNELKKQILKEGNTLLTKRDLLERFCEIDKEYNGRPWNLLQILANINILIGEEPCEDAISRAQALSDYADWYGYGYRDNAFYKLLKDMPSVTPKLTECEDAISRQAVLDKIKEVCFSKEKEWVDFRTSYGSHGQRDLIINFIEDSPSVQPKPKAGHWIYDKSIDNWRCSECNETPKIGYCGLANFMAKHFKFCNHCGARMIEPQESEDKE